MKLSAFIRKGLSASARGASVLGLLALILSASPLAAQDDDEELFGGEETVVQADADDSSIREAFLKSEGVELSGSFSGSAGASATWNDPWGGAFALFGPDSSTFDPASSLSLAFSAKPDTDLGFYGEVRTAYPFAKDGVPDISVFKLYSKFNWNDALFFSFGKQSLAWGQGWFFAPANDILSLGAVDLYDPEAEREGPLSLKAQVPFLGSMMNAYLFLIAPAGAEHVFDVALAPKLELSLPSVELGLSAYYQRDDKARLILSGSYARDELSAFGEALVKFGTDRLYVLREERAGIDMSPVLPLKTFSYRIVEGTAPAYFTGTAGIMYRDSWEKKLSLTVVAQYLYDGEAQANIGLNEAGEAIAERLDPRYPETGDPAIDMTNPAGSLARFGSRLGRHYGALSVNASDILDSDISVSLFAMANLYDFSGWLRPQVSWQLFKRMQVSAYAQFSFGGEGDEYTNMGGIYKALQGLTLVPGPVPTFSYADANLTPPLTLGLSLSLGSGAF